MTIATNAIGSWGHAAGYGAPAANVISITPHATNELSNVVRGIYVGTAGDVEVITVNDQTVIFVGAAAGSVIPVVCKQVLAANTTADNLLGMY